MQRDVLSPLTPMAPPQSTRRARGTPKEVVSPFTRRAAITSPSPTMQHLSTNDDEAERKARRRSRVMELQNKQLLSPAANNNKRRSLPYGGLSNHQMAEHYTNCIKLSAENKITSKNAFGLHLIDYMSELLKKKELDNFQVASSTLAASAKIYAGRVDAIHSETYKVLSGLGRGAEEKQSQEDEYRMDEADGDKATERKKKRRKAKTVETNMKNITLEKFNLEFEVDPLFEKTAAAFDEGGTSGLLYNHLQYFDGSIELVIDSSSVVTGNDVECKLRESNAKELVDLTEFRDVYSGMKFNSLEMCPSFANFEFTNWDRESTDNIRTMIQKMSKSDHAFDMDAEPEPIQEPIDDMQPMAEMSFNDDDDDSDNESVSSDMTVILGDRREAQLVDNAMSSMKHGTIGTLMQVLSTEPGDYSYFNTSNMKMWAGPEHWKPGLSKGLTTENTEKVKKPKDKKQAFKLEYEQPIEMDSFFKKTRAATTNSKKTIEGYNRIRNTLPGDIHYDEDKLFRLFNKPHVMVTRSKANTPTSTMDEAVENYNYDNENDRQNFCPAVEGTADDNLDDNDGDLDMSLGGSDFCQDSQGSFGDSVINNSVFVGDNLVAQPNKVNKINIDYAKKAKRVDVKRLKAAMWGLLTQPEEEKKPQQDTEETDKDEPQSKKAKEKDDDNPVNVDAVTGEQSFQHLLHHLPDKVSKNMSNNLSVPIAFVSLLHLANEKTLSIHGNEEMSDLYISQDPKGSKT